MPHERASRTGEGGVKGSDKNSNSRGRAGTGWIGRGKASHGVARRGARTLTSSGSPCGQRHHTDSTEQGRGSP